MQSGNLCENLFFHGKSDLGLGGAEGDTEMGAQTGAIYFDGARAQAGRSPGGKGWASGSSLPMGRGSVLRRRLTLCIGVGVCGVAGGARRPQPAIAEGAQGLGERQMSSAAALRALKPGAGSGAASSPG